MDLKILLVDDEQKILDELKKALNLLEPEWKIESAISAKDALKILEKSKVELILTDMRMPEMDGAELLLKVKKKYPQIIRIIASSPADKSMLFSSTQVAHQFLVKPYNPVSIRRKIAKTFTLRRQLQSDSLIKIINSVENLPSLPEVFFKLEKALHSPNVSAQEVGKIISQDITMTAKIMQFVNSPFFGLQRKINDPVQAVSMLGINTVKSLVLHLKVFSAFEFSDSQSMSIEELWIHSMRVAQTAKRLIGIKSNDSIMLDNANVAGILHDIGKLILCNVKGYFSDTNELIRQENLSQVEAEYRVFGTSHAEVGAYLLSVWGLSDEVIETVAFHHIPSKLNSKEFNVTTAVHLANALVHFVPFIDVNYLQSLGLDTNILDLVLITKKNY